MPSRLPRDPSCQPRDQAHGRAFRQGRGRRRCPRWASSVWRKGEGTDLEAGGEITVSIFTPGQMVDVRGVTKGRGFSGVVRRHHFRTQDATHGNSRSHRVHGSIGQNQTPGRVFKGKKMAGHLGSVQRCQQNLEVVRVDAERNLLLVRGGVPGPTGGHLVVLPSVKQKNKG